MQPGTHEFARTNFGLSWGTLVFYLLSCVTCCILMFIWMWNLSMRVSNPQTSGTNKLLLILSYAFIPLFFLPVSPVLWLIMSFRTKTGLEQMLAQHGMPQHLNGFLCFIFPFLYQYYVVYHAEERYYNAQMVRQAYAQGHPGAPYQQGAPYPGSYPQGGAPHPSQYQQAVPPQGYTQNVSQGSPQPRATAQNNSTPPHA